MENVIVKQFTYLLAATVLTFSQYSMASTIILPSPNEVDLIGTGGILDNEFGLANVQRIGDDVDLFWKFTGQDATVTAVAKYAGYRQYFGFIDGNDSFTSVLYVPYMNGQSNTFSDAHSESSFRFGLKPSGSLLLSSDPSDNIFCQPSCSVPQDHMVSWLITGGAYKGDYVVAWEDLTDLGDHDYNDLVIRVSGVTVVPVPAAIWLFGSGLLGLAAIKQRRV
jgi:hypothetical protein